MQTQLRETVNNRTFMLAAISHDLRTVLTRLKLRVEFIEDEQQIQKAIADINQMHIMLSETLAFAREASATEAWVKFDLAVSLQSLCDDYIDTGKNAAYKGPAKLAYIGQPSAISRAFINLIDNAVTYGQEAEIAIVHRKAAIEVTISDRGPGIPDGRKAEVFAPFFRLEHSRSRETGGTGLGLMIAKQVIQRHGGNVFLSNRQEGGLQVQISLPVQK